MSSRLQQTLAGYGLVAFIFGLVFFAGMSIVFVLISPARFPVDVHGSIIRMGELSKERDRLDQQTENLVSEEKNLKLLVSTPTLDALKELRAESAEAFGAFIHVQEAIDILDKRSITVAIDALEFDMENNSIVLTGAVQNRSGKSSAGLAAFVDALRDGDVYERVSEPEYKEMTDANGNSYSPFSLVITLFEDAR